MRQGDGRNWVVGRKTAPSAETDLAVSRIAEHATCISAAAYGVESVLRSHAAIFDAVVIGRPHDRWGEEVVAIISLSPGEAAPARETMRSFLRERLAGYKCPKSIIIADQVQRSPAGKQDHGWAKEFLEDAKSLKNLTL